MKPLLSQTIRPFMLYILLVLVVSVPVYYVVVDTIWKSELDEHNRVSAQKTAEALNAQPLSEQDLAQHIALWNRIAPSVHIQALHANSLPKDSMYTVLKKKNNIPDEPVERYRCLKTVMTIHRRPFLFTVATNIEESTETIGVIAGLTLFFFLLIAVGLLLLSRKLSYRIWKPFHETLQSLKQFNLNQHKAIVLTKSDIAEFEELNQALQQLIGHSVAVFHSQKEFTENAAHELQTPLAILKNKLDMLLQSDGLTEKQYQLAEDMNRTLQRSSRIHKNLLMLAKLENKQFELDEEIALDTLIEQHLAGLSGFIPENIKLKSVLLPAVFVKGNSALTDILFHNLVINALAHTPEGGLVEVLLDADSLSVRNTGTQALPAEQLFVRFSRLSSHRQGSGLGLAIAKAICVLHHWKIHYHFAGKQHIFTVSFKRG